MERDNNVGVDENRAVKKGQLRKKRDHKKHNLPHFGHKKGPIVLTAHLLEK